MKQNETYKAQIQALIAAGKTKTALELLLKWGRGTKLEKNIIGLQSTHKRLEDSYLKSQTITNDKYNANLNRLHKSILLYCEDLEQVEPTRKHPMFFYIFLLLGLGLVAILIFRTLTASLSPEKYDTHLYFALTEDSSFEEKHEKALKHLVREFNSYLRFNQITINDMNLADYYLKVDVKRTYINIIGALKKLHPVQLQKNEVISVLTDFPISQEYIKYIFDNIGKNYQTSIFDCPKKSNKSTSHFDASLIRYVIIKVAKASLVERLQDFANQNKIAHDLIYPYHINFKGCLLDFREDETTIESTFDRARICAEHQIQIKAELGDDILEEYEKMIQLDWINQSIKDDLSHQYNIQL